MWSFEILKLSRITLLVVDRHNVEIFLNQARRVDSFQMQNVVEQFERQIIRVRTSTDTVRK